MPTQVQVQISKVTLQVNAITHDEETGINFYGGKAHANASKCVPSLFSPSQKTANYLPRGYIQTQIEQSPWKKPPVLQNTR